MAEEQFDKAMRSILRVFFSMTANLFWVVVGVKLNSHSLYEGRETPLHLIVALLIAVVGAVLFRYMASNADKID